jgi:hypothetical protein
MIDLIDRPTCPYRAPAVRFIPASGLFGTLKTHFRPVDRREMSLERFQHLMLEERSAQNDIKWSIAA